MSWRQYFAYMMGEQGEEREELIHAIIPTTAVMRLQESPVRPSNELQAFIVRENSTCCKCQRSVLEDVSYFGLRVLLVPKRAGVTMLWAAFCIECVSSAQPHHPDGQRLLLSNPERKTLMACAAEVFENGGAGYSCLGLLDFAEAFNVQSRAIVKRMGKSKPRHCRACLKTDVPLMRCSGCNYVRYCSVECSRAKWPIHKAECAFLSKAELLFDTSFRLFIMNKDTP